MNFGLNIATIEETRKKELKQRVIKLHDHTDTFPQQLAKSPKTDYKKRFMTYMYDIDKYMYLIVQFNYLFDKLEIHNIKTDPPKTLYRDILDLETSDLQTADRETLTAASTSTSPTLVKKYFKPIAPDLHKSNESLNSSFSAPVLDTSNTEGPKILTHGPKTLSSLFDFLSEPIPSTSQTSPNNKKCGIFNQQQQQNIKDSKDVRTKHISGQLISFSCDSYSSLCSDVKKITAFEQGEADEKHPAMAAQTTLPLDTTHTGIIMHVDGPVLWIVIDNDMFSEILHGLNEYYNNISNFKNITRQELLNMQLYSYYDEKSECWYRCFVLSYEEGSDLIKLFLLDSGHIINHSIMCISPCQTERVDCPIMNMQPLAAEFCHQAPLARCCHLEHLDFSHSDTGDIDAVTTFLEQFEHCECEIRVEDNNSESLGVVVTFTDGIVLNDILVEEGMASWMEGYRPVITEPNIPAITTLPPAEEIDITDCPEYEDALEAVTGYHNRDEEVICKAFKGEENNMCFKGTRCKKKHIRMHPDGWTLDKMQVSGQIPALPLPKPGSWVDVRVTAVLYFNRVYVHLIEEEKPEPNPLPSFGVMLPPKTLEALMEDMNCPSTVIAYKPFKVPPAEGEYVAALYPPDGKWYRSCVYKTTRHNQSLQVKYLDFGTMCWVKETDIRHLDDRYLRLPAQAVLCQLAGLWANTDNYASLHQAEVKLSDLVLNHVLEAFVVSRSYDEMEIQLLDPSGFCVAKQLATIPDLKLVPYYVVNDSETRKMFLVQ